LLRLLIIVLVSALFVGSYGIRQTLAADNSPRLVLQITIDGLRGDLLRRYGNRFGKGGFRYLLEQGTHYTNAHYNHANTETIVGHTTLATGAHPSEHGMVGNVIFDRDKGELAYNIEDADYPLLPTDNAATDAAQVDPAQKRSRSQGRSPVNILASTISDEMAVHYNGKSKIFGVSGKDRSAVAMAGHAGKAFWYSTNSGDFQTSAFYYEAYPTWVKTWNAQRLADSYSGEAWALSAEIGTYLLGDRDDRPYETDLKGYLRTFPHPYGKAGDKLFYTRLLVSPVGDKLVLDFTKSLIDNENLGRDDVPDYLSVSFSGVDAINHFFGPSSLENEEVVLQTDKVLAELFEHIEKTVGLDRSVIVLAADHGMPEAPELMAEFGMATGRLDPNDLEALANDATKAAFGKDNLVLAFFRPYFYLNQEEILAAGLDQLTVEKTIADALAKKQGIALAISTKALPMLQDTPVLKKIRNNTHAQNSGDIYVVQEPYWYLQEGSAIAVMHGTPWVYDTYVPIIFAGAGIGRKTVDRLVHPVFVAPTLAAILGIKPPSSAMSGPLVEVLEGDTR